MDNPFGLLDEKISRVEAMLAKLLNAFEKQSTDNCDRYLSPDECRALFYPAISKSTLYRWTRDGKITKYLTPGGKPAYKKSEVETAVKTLKICSNKKAPIEMEAG